MKRLVLCFVTLVVILAHPIYASSLISTFDADAEGWTLTGGLLTSLSTGGNPDGHLTMEDEVVGFLTTSAPAKFLGDLSSFDGGLLSFDVILLVSTSLSELPEFGTVTIKSPSDSASLDIVAGTPASSWVTYSTPLDAISWGQTQPTWNSILSNVSQISLVVDSFNGLGDTIGFDNFKIIAPSKEVEIDIKPGSDPNCFNNDGNGVIPVAILGSANFDVNTIDAGSVVLEGMSVAVKGKSNKLLAHIEDVNNDGFDDLVVQIEDTDNVFSEGDATATLTGNLKSEFGGTSFLGTDSICIVGNANAPALNPRSKLTTTWARVKSAR